MDIESLIRQIVREEVERLSIQKQKEDFTKTKNGDNWGSVKQAEDMFGYKWKKLHSWIMTGKIEAMQEAVGCKWSINLTSIERYLAKEAKERQKKNLRRMAV